MIGKVGLVAGLVALAGCGGGGDPEAVLKDFLKAAEAGDNERACQLLSKHEKRLYEIDGGSCEESLSASPNPDTVDQVEAGKYQVERDRDRVVVRPDNGLGGYQLVKQDGEWRVASSR